MNPQPAPAQIPVIPLQYILTAISDMTRWRILNELLKSEPLPIQELARRIHVPPTNISKHVSVLLKFGLLQRGYGSVFRIPAHFLVLGERALDLGAVLLRLDRLDAK